MLQHDSQYTLGCDEAGRGTLLGSVVAAAVMLPTDLPQDEKALWRQIKDSKKLSEKKRFILRDYIINTALCVGIGECDSDEIDRINILQASIKAMTKAITEALAQLKQKHPDCDVDELLIDGDRFTTCYIVPGENIIVPHRCITGGDNKYLNIAAASIVAKCYRDERIVNECAVNPMWNDYDFAKNKGYGTAKHIGALKKFGYLPEHRKTFNPVSSVCARAIGPRDLGSYEEAGDSK
jgi:ribonuclease HII